METNHYQILSVPRNAPFSDIKKAYRFLVYHFHPNRNIHSERELLEINEAYRVLSDPILRNNYDKTLPDYDEFNNSTPQLKWLKDTQSTISKPVDDLKLSEAKGIRRDINNLLEYLKIAPVVYSYNSTYVSPVHILHL